MTNLSSVEDVVLIEVLRSGLDDWVEMGEVSGILEHSAEIHDPAVARATARRVIAELFERGLMNPGNVRSSVGFVPCTTESALAVLDQTWPVDHFPQLGELALWLDLTDKGKQWLRTRGLTAG